jgi:Flp pilus assembly protein TadG
MTTMLADIAKCQDPKTKQVQSQKGNVLVEFALILPVFLALLFGVITFSVALYNKTVLTMATREGARAGILYVPNSNDNTHTGNATASAMLLCQNNLITFGSGMVPNVTSVIDPSTKTLKVTASYSYTGLYNFAINLPISAETSMKLE